MSTAVLEVDVAQGLTPLSLGPAYEAALILVRLNGAPVGKLRMRVGPDGMIDARELREAILGQFASDLGEERTRQAVLGAGAWAAPATSATVAICTRERPDDLRRCLTAVLNLHQDGQDVLVVDNRPATDATRQVVAEFPAVRYVREDRRGLNAARNRALAEAHGEVVAFVDDDAVVDAAWLRELAAPFADPEVQCVTGLTMPLELETEGQEMFEAYAGFSRRGFRERTFQWPAQDPFVVGAVGAGANMAIRRRAIDLVGPFDPALDAGTISESGGDHEFFSRLLRAGYRIVYRPRALNWHRHRRTVEELERAIYGYGVGTYAAWTRALLEREWTVLRHGWAWFWYDQARNLFRSAIGGRRMDVRLQMLELAGCLHGPFKYLRARAQARADG